MNIKTINGNQFRNGNLKLFLTQKNCSSPVSLYLFKGQSFSIWREQVEAVNAASVLYILYICLW